TGAWLRQSPSPDELSRGELGDVFAFLLLAAGQKNMIGAKGSVRGHDDADRSVDPRKFLDGCNILHITHAGAAVCGRKNYPHEPELAQFLHRSQRKLARLVPIHKLTQDL